MYVLVRGSAAAKMDHGMRKGIFVGILKRSDEAVVMTPEGARNARSIRSVIDDERYDQELLNQALVVPWDEDGEDGDVEPSVILPAGVDARPVHDTPITPPEAVVSRPVTHRSVHITNDALMTFGYTAKRAKVHCKGREHWAFHMRLNAQPGSKVPWQQMNSTQTK